MADIAGFPNIPKAGGLYSAYLVSLKDWIYDEDSSNNTSWLTVRQKSGIAGYNRGLGYSVTESNKTRKACDTSVYNC